MFIILNKLTTCISKYTEDNRSQVSLFEEEFMSEERGKASRSSKVLDWNWRYQNELMVSISLTFCVCMCVSLRIHLQISCSVPWEGLEAMEP